MIAHTGNLPAGIKAVTATDLAVGAVVQAARKHNARVVITADHGNVEKMIDERTGEIDTEHSVTPVPFILVDDKLKNKKSALRKSGVLGDIAPTILELFGLPQPKEMTGKSLIELIFKE